EHCCNIRAWLIDIVDERLREWTMLSPYRPIRSDLTCRCREDNDGIWPFHRVYARQALSAEKLILETVVSARIQYHDADGHRTLAEDVSDFVKQKRSGLRLLWICCCVSRKQEIQAVYLGAVSCKEEHANR